VIRRNPFPGAPPRYVRVRFFRYRFTSWRERRETRAWWARRYETDDLPPLRLEDLGRVGI